MRITRHSTLPGGLYPEAAAVLKELSGAKSFHANYSCRAPVGVYNVSLQQVLPQFATVTRHLEPLMLAAPQALKARQAVWHEEVLPEYERLLYSIAEHLEDCKRVLECYYPDRDTAAKSKPIRAYDAAVRPFRSHIGLIVTAIKHNQSRLRGLFLYDTRRVAPGYFVEGVRSGGVVGPHPEVHPRYDEAFSFARDLRFLFAHIYITSHHLATALRAVASPGAQGTATGRTGEQTIAEVATALTRLPWVVYPNELAKDVPLVELTPVADDDVTLAIEYPAASVEVITLVNPRVSCGLVSDGLTEYYKVPMFSVSARRQ